MHGRTDGAGERRGKRAVTASRHAR